MDRYKPAVTADALLFFAGGLWVAVGCVLVGLAASWLLRAAAVAGCIGAAVGVGLAALAHRYAFRRVVLRNRQRILAAEGKRCAFSFMPWKSYLLIPVMVAMGVLLRHSSLPRTYLAVLYTAMGGALVVSGLTYLDAARKELRRRFRDAHR